MTVAADLHAFWSTPTWHAYERAYGDVPGTRAALVAGATWDTYVLDLTQDEATLWRGVRKSYHSLINKKLPHVSVFGAGQTVFSSVWCIQKAHDVHVEAAGRETRSPETWDVMKQWLASGDALIAMAPGANGGVVGYAYAVRGCGWSYYFSGASTVQNVNHALVWALVKALRCDGRTKVFEVGWAARHEDTDKDRQIAFFKAGFGGVPVPLGRKDASLDQR